MKTALLLSGGMDSIAVAYWRHPAIALTIDYGQRPAPAEVRAATAVAKALDIEHHVLRIDASILGSGDLAGQPPLQTASVPEWWPYRNQMLVTFGAMKGIALGVRRLLIGTLASDTQHADGRPAFIAAMNSVLEIQEGGITLHAPAIKMTAAQLLQVSKVPLDLLAWAHSCHVSEFACGLCRGCRKHYETLQEIGVEPY